MMTESYIQDPGVL